MIIHSKVFGLLLNLIILGAVALALNRVESVRWKFTLISLTVLLFMFPYFFPAVPPNWKWLVPYLSKIGVGLVCLIYVRLKK